MLIRDLIEQHKSELTAAERKLVPFLKDDSSVIALQSITKLAEAAQVSTPTVLRLARKLGFNGFPDLHNAVRMELAERMKQPLAKLSPDLASGKSDDLVASFARRVVENINQTVGQLDDRALENAANLLSEHDRSVHLIGGRITAPLAQYFANHLQILRPKVTLMNSEQRSWPQTLLDLDDTAALIIFDIRRYEKKMERLAELAASRGAKILLFTDQWGSPVEKHADYCFRSMVDVPSSWDSTIAINFLVEILVAQVQRQGGPQSAQRIEEIERMIGATQIF